MSLDSAVIKFISEKAQCDITTPSGAARLRNDIESVTGQNLSLNTIKRLTGVLQCNSRPRIDTLEILAQYLGCDSWLQLTEVVSQSVSSFDSDHRFIDMAGLSDGTIVEITWAPNRRILIKHIDGDQYKVIEAENSKIKIGDMLKLSKVALFFPFMAQKVIRDDINIGSYTAASRLGINSFRIL